MAAPAIHIVPFCLDSYTEGGNLPPVFPHQSTMGKQYNKVIKRRRRRAYIQRRKARIKAGIVLAKPGAGKAGKPEAEKKPAKKAAPKKAKPAAKKPAEKLALVPAAEPVAPASEPANAISALGAEAIVPAPYPESPPPEETPAPAVPEEPPAE